MELAVLRRETSGEGVAAATATNSASAAAAAPPPDASSNAIFTETQTLVKYEIMDGAPVNGEVISVNLSLRGIPADLTPTYAAINNRFSVRCFLNLVLVDEEDCHTLNNKKLSCGERNWGENYLRDRRLWFGHDCSARDEIGECCSRWESRLST